MNWLTLLFLCFWVAEANACPLGEGRTFYLNTSNEDKLKEFREYLPGCEIVAKKVDLPEPQADPLTVIQYKASQFPEGTIVDDASLDVQGVDIGVNIKWLIPKLGELTGRASVFTCLLGYRQGEQVHIYRGSVNGTLVAQRGTGFGVGPYFLPDGAKQTLGEYMDPQLNPRYRALQAFINNSPLEIRSLLKTWQGKFQEGL